MQPSLTVRGSFVLLVVGIAGCESPSPGAGQSSRSTEDLALDGLSEGVAGELASEAFAAEDAYFRVFRGEGRRRVDLVFAEVVQDDCGLPLTREGRRVFVRFTGVDALPLGDVVVDREGEDDVSVHYERKIEGRWVGVGSGVARLALDGVSEARATGRLHACFDDGAESCVSGSFSARRCTSRLDGYLPREGTGVADPPTARESSR